jgi:hypothetical protein
MTAPKAPKAVLKPTYRKLAKVRGDSLVSGPANRTGGERPLQRIEFLTSRTLLLSFREGNGEIGHWRAANVERRKNAIDPIPTVAVLTVAYGEVKTSADYLRRPGAVEGCPVAGPSAVF